MKLRQKFSALAPALMVLTLAASATYAQDDDKKAPANPATLPAQSQSQASPAPAEKRAGAATIPTRATLSDGQILQIVRTLNDAEIKQANEAIDEGESQEVKTLAEMIKADHEMSNESLDELLEGDRNLEDSPVDDQLKASAEDTHERLQDLAGNQYDCAYINAQVTQHEAALAMTKDQLMSNAKSADVGKFLTTKQMSLEHHLQMAKDTLGKVQGCSATQTSQSQPAPRSTQ
jgi:putative membrane protein